MDQSTFVHFPQFATFGALSIFVLLASIALAVVLYFRKKKTKSELSAIHILTIGVALAGFFVFVPIYFFCYEFGDTIHPIRSVLLSLHNTFRIFILDGEFDIVRDAVEPAPSWFRKGYSIYASFLYVLAPCLTFTNLMSLFQNLWDEIRFAFAAVRPIYIFSELSDASLAMAESLIARYEAADSKARRPILVFTDVFIQEEEEDYELRLKARDLKAICLKRDITRVNVRRKKCHIEFFLLGEDESENMEQAIKLTQENKHCANRSIFLYTMYANQQTASYILDSIDKGNLTLHRDLITAIDRDPVSFLEDPDAYLPANAFDFNFYVRRVDNVGELARQMLTSDEMANMVRECEGHTISLLIIGMGSYGKAILQNALWLYQLWGYDLEITIFDSRAGDGSDLLQNLRKDWPEIVCDDSGHYVNHTEGDCHYDLQFFTNIDCFGYQFQQIFEQGSPYHQRLARTKAAFISLGNDDLNIEASVMLRSLFDRVNHVGEAELNTSGAKSGARLAASKDLPLLYAIVYDDRKAGNLTSQNDSMAAANNASPDKKTPRPTGLINHKQQPLHINFLGSLSSQYAYDVIEQLKAIERIALRYHTEWIWNMYRDDDPNNNIEAISAAIRSGQPLYKKDKDGNYELDKEGNKIDLVQEMKDYIFEAMEQYTRFEYYRNASIGRALHKAFLTKLYQVDTRAATNEDGTPSVLAEDSIAQSVNEHARWNAFMRVHGFRLPDMVGTGISRYSAKGMKPYRNDRGLTHNLLVPWDLLPKYEKQKDAMRRAIQHQWKEEAPQSEAEKTDTAPDSTATSSPITGEAAAEEAAADNATTGTGINT